MYTLFHPPFSRFLSPPSGDCANAVVLMSIAATAMICLIFIELINSMRWLGSVPTINCTKKCGAHIVYSMEVVEEPFSINY